MIKAILFDFNGVIINDEPVQMRAYQEILKDDGIDLTEADYFGSLGMDDRTFVAAAFERAGKKVDEAKIGVITAKKSDRWRELVADGLPLFDGIVDFVDKMSREFSLGIVSMAGRHEIEFVLEKSGLAKHFTAIVSAADVEKCKPDPACFRLGFQQLDSARTAQGHLPMTHGECLVIEDSPPGIIGARNADLPALGVTNTVSADELRAAGAGAVATDLRDWMPESIRRVFV
ncbi:MAG TPA: HAD family phosphatase [Pyrinomonadaceae bacterium]|nr:HAD family phosphatase [Pyrinomonadaceae bacterium]